MRAKVPSLADFTSMAWQLSQTDQAIIYRIQQGKEPLMPAYRDKLSEQQIGALAIYIRAFAVGSTGTTAPKTALAHPPPSATRLIAERPAPKKTQTVQAMPAISSKRPATSTSPKPPARTSMAAGPYRQYCLICHGADGRGSEVRASMPTIPDFSSGAWQESVSNAQLIVGILDGKGTLMPAFRDRVNDDQAQDLVAYVRAFGPGEAPKPEIPSGDFHQRFRKARDEWEELKKQLQELSQTAGKP
jgi:cytochrome c oxidase cbb3-type subunit 3